MPLPESDLILARLRDARLAAHAVAAAPAWLWSFDATRILWANATAAALFAAPDPTALAARRFDSTHPAAAQIARLAQLLPHDAPPRLERLRGFGAGLGRPLTCACSHITLADHTPAILVAAAESAGPALPLVERVRRLFAECGQAVAVFAVDGLLLHATPAATDRLAGATSLAALGGDAIAGQALADGHAAGSAGSEAVTIERLGSGSAGVLMVTFGPRQLAVEPARGEVRVPADAELVKSAPAQAAPAPRERRQPLRFVWHIDADGRFGIESDEFIALMGPRPATALGRPWNEIAAELDLDAAGDVARALASRDTWSNVMVAWPVDGSSRRLAVELSGLPVFDRRRTFSGYRGFGVCRDLASIAALTQGRLSTVPAEQVDATEDAAAAANVVPFRGSDPPADLKSPTLTPVERRAFRELARQLIARLKHPGRQAAPPLPPINGEGEAPAESAPSVPPAASVQEPRDATGTTSAAVGKSVSAPSRRPARPAEIAPIRTMPMPAPEPAADAPPPGDVRTVLDSLSVGVLVYRLDALLYANRAFLTWIGHASLAALAEAGGLDNLLVEPGAAATGDEDGAGRSFIVSTTRGDTAAVEGRLVDTTWNGERAHMLTLASATVDDRHKTAELALRRAEAESRELRSILDTATDGVIVIAHDGRIVSCNRSAEALFAWDAGELAGRPFADLFAPESQRVAADYLDGLQRAGVASLLNDGREVIGRVRQGGLIPLFMTMGRIADDTQKFCAVFRDITQWKKAEEELVNARRLAEKASSAKSEFLAKISHEIRTPLNAVIGFSEVMMSERFGPVGNERYRAYLKDIHTSGAHLVSLINDLLDLSKIEAGKLDLTFTGVNLNELTQQCVAIMQPQANRERIIIRTSIAPSLPQIVADARSVRQIVLNLLSNSIKFTGAGGQVIVSTALSDAGEAVLRVRDTGVGMSEKDIATAMEPFRQLATSARWGSGGTGLGLPLTKALAEANRASFTITSAPNAGTLVEVTFPATRVLTE